MRLVLWRKTAGASRPSGVASDRPRRRHDDRRQPPDRLATTAQLRDAPRPDRRIAEYTGQPFGEAYFEGLLRDETAVFDSAPPIAAVLAAEQSAGRGLELLGRLQSAHYEEGRRIADEAVLLELAKDLGLEPKAFQAAFKEAETDRHIKDSRALLAEVGGQGFPTFALERNGQFTLIDIGPWLGKPQAFAAWLSQSLPAQTSSSELQACGLNGCAD